MQIQSYASKLKFLVALCAIYLSILATAAHAELVYGVGGLGDQNGNPTGALTLFTFDTAAPGTNTTIGTISGITSGQTLEGIAFAPNGTLYALGYVETAGSGQGNSQLYTINLTTGAATAVNATPVNLGNAPGGLSAYSFGLAFVSSNAIQVIDAQGNIFQLNSSTGGVIPGSVTSVTYSSNPSSNNIPQFSDLAQGANGRLYTIDMTNNQLAIRQTANPSLIDPIGIGLGITTSGPGSIGFDINGASGTAYLQTDTGDAGVADDLYSVNLSTGAVTFIGQIGANSNFNTIDIALPATAVPEPATFGLTALGVATLLAFACKRRS